jgi:hypothetical protein
MTFRQLAELVGKKQKTVEVFFARKKLSIRRPDDVRRYVAYTQRDRQWRTSTYSAPHLRSFHFQRKQRGDILRIKNISGYDAKLITAFPRYIYWDRPADSMTKSEFIQRVVRYGALEDIQLMLKKLPITDIHTVYPDRHALLADTAGGLLNIPKL